MADPVTYDFRDGIAALTLDDGKVNAMALPFFRGLDAAFDRAEREGARALVIAGRPGFFSAGLDLKLLPTLAPDELRESMLAFGRVMLRAYTLPMPTVAAVTGHAVAGGALLAYLCDLRFLADGPFRLHMNETAIGIALPTWILTVVQPAIPPRWQTEALLHARAYSPAEAKERGLVTDVVPAERVFEVARAAAGPLAALDTRAYAASKRRLRAAPVAWAEARLEAELVALPSR
jgi:enoyl-CoA hydratase